VVKIKFPPQCHPQTSLTATRAQVTLPFDWLTFAVKLATKQALPRMPANQIRVLPLHARVATEQASVLPLHARVATEQASVLPVHA